MKIAVFLLAPWLLQAAGADLEEARKFYNLTSYEQSLKVLQAIPTKDASVYQWMGRSYFMLGEYKKATEVLEKAQAANPSSSDAALWLGRAWGRRAETSSVLTAPGYASKARTNFEKAVQLNPRNLEALSDLFEYYLEAPGFLGGGFDKAQSLAVRMGEVEPAEGAWAQYRLAEKRKEFGKAEEQLQRAIEISPQKFGRFIDMARFFVKHGRFQEAQESLAQAEKVDPGAPKLLYEKADLYIRQGKNLDVAKDLLGKYMRSRLTPDDPPRSEAAKLLKKIEGS